MMHAAVAPTAQLAPLQADSEGLEQALAALSSSCSEGEALEGLLDALQQVGR